MNRPMPPPPPPPSMRQAAPSAQFYAVRLMPGQDLKTELLNFSKQFNIQAGFIATCVGSLTMAHLRLADATESDAFQGPFEILSLVGTLAQSGVHLHIAIANDQGQTWGGHLLEGCPIHTTAEIVIGDITHLKFEREMDPITTYSELSVKNRI